MKRRWECIVETRGDAPPWPFRTHTFWTRRAAERYAESLRAPEGAVLMVRVQRVQR